MHGILRRRQNARMRRQERAIGSGIAQIEAGERGIDPLMVSSGRRAENLPDLVQKPYLAASFSSAASRMQIAIPSEAVRTSSSDG